MRRESLDRAIGPTPPSFSGRMEQTLRTLKEEKEVKRTGFRIIMVFAIIASVHLIVKYDSELCSLLHY